MEIRRQDGIERCTQIESVHSSSLSKLESFLNDTCHIPFKFFIYKETKQLKWRDLMGPEKHVLLKNINLPTLFPKLPKVVMTQTLWEDFRNLHQILQREDISQAEADHFGVKAKNWVRSFTAIYQTKHVTPYIHVMAMHIPEFLKQYGNLVQFTQQGMEKLNDQTTIDFARSTNHNYCRNLDALKQLMDKKNRIEHLEDHGFQRQPGTVTCRPCTTYL